MTESGGAFVRTKFMRSCLEIRTCDPTNVHGDVFATLLPSRQSYTAMKEYDGLEISCRA